MTNPQNPYGNPEGNNADAAGAGNANGGLPSYGSSQPQNAEPAAGQPGEYGAGADATGAPRFGTDAGAGAGAGNGAAQAGYQQGGYQEYQSFETNDPAYDPAFSNPSKLALVAFIFGLLCIPAAFVGLSILPGVVAVILAIVALIRNRKKVKPAKRTWMSVVALILGIVGIIWTGFIMGGAVLVFSDCFSLPEDQIQACVDSKMNV